MFSIIYKKRRHIAVLKNLPKINYKYLTFLSISLFLYTFLE